VFEKMDNVTIITAVAEKIMGKKEIGYDLKSDWSWGEYPVIYNLVELDRRLRSFVPALFSTIKIIDNKKIIVEVPHRVAPRVVEYLRIHYRCGVPLEVVGV